MEVRMIHGNEILEILRTKYERIPDLKFADKADLDVGDLLFGTGNGVNAAPQILRVKRLDPDKPFFECCRIEPSTCRPCNAAERECEHASCYLDGSLLLTKILTE